MKKLNVVIIRNAQQYDFGGGERFPVFVADVLTKNHTYPTIISRHKKLLDLAASKDLITIRGWWWSRQNWSGKCLILIPLFILWQFFLFLWYSWIFFRIGPQAVHIQSRDDFIAATFAAKFCNARVVWTDHADLKHALKNITIWYKNPVGKLVYLAAHAADAITVVSKSELREVTAHLAANSSIRDKLTIVYNGCQDVLKSYKRTHENEKFTYVFAGRIVKDKGIGEALEAFRRLHKEHTDTALIVAGEGPESDTFIKIAKAIDGVSFIGHQADPYPTIMSGDVFIQPTYHEGFSVVLVEASMLEKPIIATNVGGNSEIIEHGATGLLVPPRSSNGLYEAMKTLYLDRSLANRLAKSARTQYLERFVFDRIVRDQFIPLYRGGGHEN